MLINQKWRKSLADVRTRQGADVGSDHQLLIAKLRLKLRKNKKSKGPERPYGVGKLIDQETRLAFQVELQNRYDLLQEAKSRGIRLILNKLLEDLDFADDLLLLASSQKNMQDKATDLDKNSQEIGFKHPPREDKDYYGQKQSPR